VDNRDTRAARQYHDATKHSWQSVRLSRHYLDFANQPLPYKIYETLEPIPLPREFPPAPVAALDALAGGAGGAADKAALDLATLARLCLFSNGVTKVLRTFGGELAFRAAACTGALYHIEHYLACADLADLPAGLYHYAAHDHSLRRLRAGDIRAALVAATGDEPAVAAAPVVMVQTSTFWRNAWKYQERAYRHSFWDGGTVLANLLAVAAALGLPARLVLGFADAPVNELLDIDPEKEAAISLVALGGGAPPPPAPPVDRLGLATTPLSRWEVDYPAIPVMHAASSLGSGAEAAAWRGAAAVPTRPPPDALVPLRPSEAAALPDDPVEGVIRRRGSSRAFTRDPIGFDQLSTLLDRAVRPPPADFLEPDGNPLCDLYLIANAVEGLDAGTYVYHGERGGLERLRLGDFREAAGDLDLGQELAADAAVNFYFLADLEPVLARFGNRGYRAAQLAAAILAGKLYLASYALRLGATGLTFFDDDVTAFFSPHAAGKSVLFLLAAGHKRRQVQTLA
jgi:SagB-type dehydrogenase family enzyme